MGLIKKLIKKVLSIFGKVVNRISLFFYRIRNRNKNFTIIARDCVGGVVYNQLNLKFLTPTINLFFVPDDFNQFCLHLKEYLNGSLVEMTNSDTTYPVGLLYPPKESQLNKPIRINFMHYKTYKEAADKWEERKHRVNWDNMFIVSTFCNPIETDTLTVQLIEEWNSIEYKKVILVDKEYGFQNEYIIEKPDKCKEHAWLLYKPYRIITWKRTMNEFDFIKFLNSKNRRDT